MNPVGPSTDTSVVQLQTDHLTISSQSFRIGDTDITCDDNVTILEINIDIFF